MVGGISQGIRYLHNSKLDVNISSFGISVHSKELEKGYGLNEPNQDNIVLKSFPNNWRPLSAIEAKAKFLEWFDLINK